MSLISGMSPLLHIPKRRMSLFRFSVKPHKWAAEDGHETTVDQLVGVGAWKSTLAVPQTQSEQYYIAST